MTKTPNIRMQRTSLVLLSVNLLLPHTLVAAESVNLSAITHLAPKARAQDQSYNPSQAVIDSLVAKGTNSIPLLIELLDNNSNINHQILDYWPSNTIGDIAFVILTDFVQDPRSRASTIPGASWEEFLGHPDPNVPGWIQLEEFKRTHGSQEIKRRWQKLWSEYHERIYWDSKGRCFRLKVSDRAHHSASAGHGANATLSQSLAHSRRASKASVT
jgi:hypothetical protein